MLKRIEKAISRVDEQAVYNITEMRKGNFFPWISQSNNISYVNAVMDDFIAGKILKAKITGEGRGRDYKIKGTNIIKYLNIQKAKYEPTSNTKGLGD